MKLISISGTHSVGKTTLANQLIKSLPDLNVSLIPEIARILIYKGFLLNQNITEWGIVNYVQEYLYHERIACSDVLISDRSLIDLLAYIKTNNSLKIRSKFIQLVEEIVYTESKRFDFYFYIPIEFPLELDNVRPTDVSYQKSVDKTLCHLFEIYNINPIILSGSISQRTSKAINIIYGKH
jgi:hypothetical protein